MNPSLAALSLLAASVVVAPRSAQDSNPPYAPEVRGGTGLNRIERVLHVRYDVQAGKVRSVRSARPDDLALSGTLCFDNSLIELPIDPQYVVANPGEELLAFGQKNCPGASRLRSFTIAYRSEANDTSIGGPGAVFGLALFSGSSGFGNVGTEVFRRTFTGLPSNGAPASPTVQYDHLGTPFQTGPAPLVFFTIDFGTEPLALADGPTGWSFLQLDGDTGPALVRAPRPILGTHDALDLFSPGPALPANYVGTFNYGGCAGINPWPPCANLFIQLDEIANSEVANTTVLNGGGTNPNILEEILPARIGHLWAARVDVVAPPWPNPDFTILYYSAAAASAPIATSFGQVLIDPAQQLRSPHLAEGSYTFSIPPDTALIGTRVFLQAAVLPPAVPSAFLTNALNVRVGF